MERIVYWATSALLKLYAPEADSSLFVRQVLSQQSELAISYLHQVELYFALHAKECRGEIAAGSAAILARSFDRQVAERRYVMIPWGEDVLEQSRRVLDRCLGIEPPVNIRSLDGLHLGALIAAGVPQLITADSRMKQAADAVGIEVIEP